MVMSAITRPPSAAASKARFPSMAASSTAEDGWYCDSSVGLEGVEIPNVSSPAVLSATKTRLPAVRRLTGKSGNATCPIWLGAAGLLTSKTTRRWSVVPANRKFPETAIALVGIGNEVILVGDAGLLTSSTSKPSVVPTKRNVPLSASEKGSCPDSAKDPNSVGGELLTS